MGLLSGVGGFVGRLVGSDKATEKLVENISSGVDKMFYTSQEKAEDAADARREGFKAYTAWIESTSGSRLARRIIALSVVGMWIIEQATAVFLRTVALLFSVSNAKAWEQAAEYLTTVANENNALVVIILLFYFGGPAASASIEGLANRWVNKTNK